MSFKHGQHERPVLKAFLSHGYRETEANLHFFDLFATLADIQFEVDDPGPFPTSTTRLQRLIRDSDAFIGIYPIPGNRLVVPTRAQLLELSKYFRLELDMAVRSRTPAIVITDRRYQRVMAVPADVVHYRYDAQELASRGDYPTRHELETDFRFFCEQALAHMAWRVTLHERGHDPGTIGIIPPPADLDRHFAYTTAIHDALSELNCTPLLLEGHLVLDTAFFVMLRRCDWVIVETSSPEGRAMEAFLHGQSVPVLRTRRVAPGDDPTALDATDRTLYGALQVGYVKDVLLWEDHDALAAALPVRVDTIQHPPRRILTADDARSYFSEAALRKQRVFLSYANEDAAGAAPFADALKERFQNVFNYLDEESLVPGKPWLDQIHDYLAQVDVGVVLMSKHYLTSGPCMSEARSMTDRAGSEKQRLFTVKLDDANPPEFLRQIHYYHSQHRTPRQIVEDIVQRLGPEVSPAARPA